jgi:hypothetical protein
VRVPAEVKSKITEVANAEGLSVSEWVQAIAAGHAPDAGAAHRRGREEGHAAGRKQGDAEGYKRGMRDGRQAVRWGGFIAGLLEAHFRAERGQGIDAAGLGQHLLDHPDQQAIAEDLLRQRGFGDALASLLRKVRRSGA